MANNINYEVDPNDSRLTSIQGEEKSELSNLEKTYADMQTNTDKYFDSQIKGWEDYGKKQAELQNQSHKLTVQGIEQDMADAKKDYIKEQSGAYVDWQQQSNQYGANAEQMAASGLTNTGFSESSQVSMYNTYQNRIMTAREAFVRAETDFKIQIAQAKLSNDTLLAEIAFNTLKETTALAIQQAQYKNTLLMDLTEKRTALKSSYWQRYSDMMTAIQREIAQKEEARVNDAKIAAEDAAKALAEAQAESLLIDKGEEDTGSNGESANLHSTLPMTGILEASKEKTFNHPSLNAISLNPTGNTPSGIAGVTLEEMAAAIANSGKGNNGIKDDRNYVNTPYYHGEKNKDASVFGTFSNGYQPKGISGHGKLSNSGQKYTFTTETLTGERKTVTQTVWKAEDGTLWYWEGRENKYKKYKEPKTMSGSNHTFD